MERLTSLQVATYNVEGPAVYILKSDSVKQQLGSDCMSGSNSWNNEWGNGVYRSRLMKIASWAAIEIYDLYEIGISPRQHQKTAATQVQIINGCHSSLDVKKFLRFCCCQSVGATKSGWFVSTKYVASVIPKRSTFLFEPQKQKFTKNQLQAEQED